MPADFYELLEVDPDASGEEIRRAYREKARRYHPDVNDHPRARGQFATLNTAREVLMDATERSRYDRLGHDDYVTQHLDGLPTMSRPDEPGDDSADDDPADEEPTDDRSSEATGASTAGAGSSRRDAGTGTAGTTSAGTGRGGRTGSSFGRDGGATTTTRTGSRKSRTTSRTTGNGARARGTTADRRRIALRRGWVAVALAALVYLGGVVGFVSTTSGGLGELSTTVVADPVGALAAGSPLPDPATATVEALTAASTGVLGPDAVFAVGLIALPLAIGVTVGRFGHGVATLYAVAAAVPLAWVAVRPFLPAPLGVDLLALALVPLGAALWFLVDVGRYVRG